MLVKVYGSAVFGIDATTITVEVNIDKGIGYHLVGLPDNGNCDKKTLTLLKGFHQIILSMI